MEIDIATCQALMPPCQLRFMNKYNFFSLCYSEGILMIEMMHLHSFHIRYFYLLFVGIYYHILVASIWTDLGWRLGFVKVLSTYFG